MTELLPDDALRHGSSSARLACLLPRFLTSVRINVDRAIDAQRRGATDVVVEIVQRLKGAGGTFGHPTITALAGDVLRAVEVDNHALAAELLLGLREYARSARSTTTDRLEPNRAGRRR